MSPTSKVAIDGTRLDAFVPQGMHDGRPLWVRYDLAGRAAARDAARFARRGRRSLWRYRELLPLPRDESSRSRSAKA